MRDIAVVVVGVGPGVGAAQIESLEVVQVVVGKGGGFQGLGCGATVVLRGDVAHRIVDMVEREPAGIDQEGNLARRP